MYSVPIDRARPGAVLLLLDQSASMNDDFGAGAGTKAEALRRAVNRLIRNLVMQAERGDHIRDYYELGILGYSGAGVSSLYGGALKGQYLVPISTVAAYPLRLETEALPENPELHTDRPVWIDLAAQGGTPMTGALNVAGSILVDWANAHADSFPPIVINVSDGEPTDGDPRPMAEQLKQLHTNDGNLLLFNVHISRSAAAPVEYPASSAGLPDKFSETLFDMSSELSPYMIAVSRNMGNDVEPGGRGFMFNADATKLSEFLDVGTRFALEGDR